jgi:molybdopterin converting factor small subunit
MTTIRIPTPLRPYTGGSKEVDVTGGTVGAALVDLSARYPDVRRHLFDDAGGLRPYVNVFLNDEDIRTLQSESTPLQSADRLMIVPSIAGGTAETQGVPVDHAALRANQASIILLLVAAFVLNATWLVAIVAMVMLAGTTLRRPGFVWVYLLLRRLGLSKPDILQDHPRPHRFAQGLGGAFLLAALGAAWLGVSWLSWGLVWLVIALAAVNLFAGFCVGCALYYWLHRLGLPGFRVGPLPSTFPGQRPGNAR